MDAKKKYIPLIHFAPSYGWMNDPNGLIYHDGIYELYYQHNPKGTEWNRMTWGHAYSTDLLHWEEKGDVLFPDENGTMFSGCAITNEHGFLGLPKDAIIYFYTAAGHHSAESIGKPFSIRMAVSLDGGNTLKKFDGEVIPSPGWESRDPKVFFHAETGAYIMVLWIADNIFGIWRSEDLREFRQTQVISLNGGFECPDLFELPVYDENGTLCDRKYVFWAADGSYYVGSFDGYYFRQEQERKLAYIKTPGGALPGNTLPYAAQSYYGIPNRVISVSWLRTKSVADTTTGVMSLPRELSIVKKETDYVLKSFLPKEICDSECSRSHLVCGETYDIPEATCDKTIVARLDIKRDKTDGKGIHGYHSEEISWSVSFLGTGNEDLLYIECMKDTGMLKLRHGLVTDFMEGCGYITEAEFIYDKGILEVCAMDGTKYFVLDFPELRGDMCTGFKILSGNIEANCSLL